MEHHAEIRGVVHRRLTTGSPRGYSAAQGANPLARIRDAPRPLKAAASRPRSQRSITG
jgi:hypothetical protein